MLLLLSVAELTTVSNFYDKVIVDLPKKIQEFEGLLEVQIRLKIVFVKYNLKIQQKAHQHDHKKGFQLNN